MTSRLGTTEVQEDLSLESFRAAWPGFNPSQREVGKVDPWIKIILFTSNGSLDSLHRFQHVHKGWPVDAVAESRTPWQTSSASKFELGFTETRRWDERNPTQDGFVESASNRLQRRSINSFPHTFGWMNGGSPPHPKDLCVFDTHSVDGGRIPSRFHSLEHSPPDRSIGNDRSPPADGQLARSLDGQRFGTRLDRGLEGQAGGGWILSLPDPVEERGSFDV